MRFRHRHFATLPIFCQPAIAYRRFSTDATATPPPPGQPFSIAQPPPEAADDFHCRQPLIYATLISAPP
jgi:hypothetical protein